MIEADIVLGKVKSSDADIPVMAHPPQIMSDISLSNFLQTITEHNNKNPTAKKGIKLDFKSIEVFESSLNILEEHLSRVRKLVLFSIFNAILKLQMSSPVWLNADILFGPINATRTKPVNADRFFAGCAKFENAVLSIGWTTCWGPHYSKGSYSNNEINEMVRTIEVRTSELN